MPKVSIIVPVYNTEKTLKKCVETLINQTFQDIEIIIVDDGSPDNAGKLCDEIANADRRIRVIHKQNGGLSSARNAGLDIAKGDYVSFIDSDDYVAYDMFEKMLSRIESDGSDIAICSHYTDNCGNLNECHLPIEKDVLEHDEIESNLILPLIGFSFYRKPSVIEGFVWRILFSRELIGEHRFLSERKYYAEDVVFDLSIYPLVKRASILQDCLYYYVFYPTSLSNKYRSGLWDMMLGLYDVKKRSALNADDKENARERLDMALIRSALGSIKNLKKTGSPLSKKECIAEIKRICANKELQGACSRSSKLHLDVKFSLFTMLLKAKFSLLIYYMM